MGESKFIRVLKQLLFEYYVLGIMLGTGEYGCENKWSVVPLVPKVILGAFPALNYVMN